MLGFGSHRRKATEAAVNGLRPIVGVMQHSYGLPAGFWQDSYVLGFMHFSIGIFAKAATRGKVSGEVLGRVLADAFTGLSNLNGVAIANRATDLAISGDPGFDKGASDASVVQGYALGMLKDDDEHDLVLRAKNVASKSGTIDRSAVVGAMLMLSFIHEVKSRLAFEELGASEGSTRAEHEHRAQEYLRDYPDDRAAVEAILLMTESLGTQTARHVAENMAGRTLTEDEWKDYGHRWERAWQAIFSN